MATEVASLTALLSLDDSGFQRGMQEAQNSMNNFGDRAGGLRSAISGISDGLQSAGASISSFGANLTLATAPIAAIGAVGLNAFGDFENTINEIGARTGVVGDELKNIADFALDMGAATVFSGKQAADAFLDLLTSGQSVEEAYSTLPHVMSLAAAGSLDLGAAADQVTDVMAMFGLGVNDMVGDLEAAEYAANTLTAASQVSSSTIAMFGDAFKNVGPIASGFGMSIEDTAAALAVMAENGIKGGEAGTILKSMLLGMSAQTSSTENAWDDLGLSLYDAEGNVKHLGLVMDELRTAMQDMNMAEQNSFIQDLAGSYGQLGLRALMFGGDMDDAAAAMRESATAAEVAEKMMDSWNNTVDSLMGSLESLAISVLWPLVDSTLKPLVNQLIEVVNGIKSWTDENPELTLQISRLLAVAVAAGPTLFAIGHAISFAGVMVGALVSPIGLAAYAIAGLAIAFQTNFGGIADLIRYLTPMVTQFFDFLFRNKAAENAFRYESQAFMRIAGAVDIVKMAFGDLLDTLSPITDAISGVFNRFENSVTDTMGRIGDAARWEWYTDVANFIAGIIRNVIIPPLEMVVSAIMMIAQAGRFIFRQLGNLLNDIFGDISLEQLFEVGRFLLSLTNPIGQISIVARMLGADLGAAKQSAIEGFTQFFWILNNGGTVFSALRSGFGAFVDDIAVNLGVPDELAQGFQSSFSNLIQNVEGLWPAITEGWDDAKDALIMFVEFFVLPALQQGVEGLKNGIKTLWDLIVQGANIVEPYLDALFQWFTASAVPAIIGFITGQLLPALSRIWSDIQAGWQAIQPDLMALAGWFINSAIPFAIDTLIWALQGLWTVISDAWEIISPVLAHIYDWFVTFAIPAIYTIITDVLVPALQGLWTVISDAWEIISPVLAHIYDWFVTFAIPAIYTIITDVLVPALQGLWDLLAGVWEQVRPALQNLLAWFTQTGLPTAVAFVTDTVIPGIQMFIDMLGTIWSVVEPALSALQAGFTAVFAALAGPVQTVLDLVLAIPAAVTAAANAISGGLGVYGGLPTGEVAAGLSQMNPLDAAGLIIGAIGAEFGGGRADGGPVTSGTPYMVGERGPELFVPSSSGSIIPNEAMGARVQINSLTINAPSGDGAALARSFELELTELMRERG